MNINKLIDNVIHGIDAYNGNIRYYFGKKEVSRDISNPEKPCIFYLMAPAFGNVGDEAIVEASLLFFRDYFPDYSVRVVEFQDTLQALISIKHIIRKTDLIVLQGGGNIGTLYYEAEVMREFIIQKFPDNKIISMPQSVYFENSSFGRRKLDRCRKIYNAHNDFTVIARDRESYEKIQKWFPDCHTILCPDIVFYLSKEVGKNTNRNRDGVLTCLRSDSEDILKSRRYDLISKIYNTFDNVVISDTCVPRNIPGIVRYYEVRSLINQFSQRELIITDRLHGMVFAALTNTPCIVLPSKDNKIKGTYNWLAEYDLIKFINIDDINDIISIGKEMLYKDFSPIMWEAFRDKHFGKLYDEIGASVN